MDECKIKFSAADNDIAYSLYEQLTKYNVSCDEIDSGYTVSNFTGKECPVATEKTCRRGEKDGVVEATEVNEYALNNYQRYQKMIEGVLKREIPWVLDDLDPKTTFDEGVREKASLAIGRLKNILRKKKIKEGTEEFREKMALGLLYLVSVPIEKTKDLSLEAREVEDELKKAGLQEFAKYVRANGGFYVRPDVSHEHSALDAIKNDKGKCTEKSKILYAVMKMAGLDPVFVKVYEIDERVIRRAGAPQPTQLHVCIGLEIKGRLRLIDPSLGLSDARHTVFFPISLRQYLAADYSNMGSMNKRGDASIEAFTTAIKIDPMSSIAYFNRGSSWARKQNLDKAISDYSESIRTNPTLLLPHIERGNAWMRKGNMDKAIADYSKAIAIKPHYAPDYFYRGLAYSAKGDLDKAIADFTEAINRIPGFVDAYYNRAMAWNKKGNALKAIADYSDAIKLDPGDDRAYYERGILWFRSGELDAAVSDLSQVIKLDPTNPYAYFLRSNAWFKKGDEAKADEDFRLAVRMGLKQDALPEHPVNLIKIR